MATSVSSARASISFARLDVPASTLDWLADPVITYEAPSANAAATELGVPMPPAAPTRTGRA